MTKISPLLTLVILGGGIGFMMLLWRFMFRSERPKCTCGAEGRLMRRQENGQRVILHYQCHAECGRIWELPEPGWEERRTQSYN